jgi:hypothetical protein
LLARVEAASGEDRALNADLWEAFGLVPEHHCHAWCGQNGRTDLTRGDFVLAWAPSYTGSLDAALSLCERVLPTFTIDLTIYRTNAGEFRPHALARLFCPYGEITEHRGDARTPALALLAAMLKGLLSAENDASVLSPQGSEDGQQKMNSNLSHQEGE